MDELEKRVEALEDKVKRPRIFLLQYLIFPALLLVGGYFFNAQIEQTRQELTKELQAAKQSFQMLELEVRRLEAAEKFLSELFSGTVERAMLSEKLISRLLADEELSKEISKTVEQYYKAEISEALTNKDLDKVTQIQTAASKIKSPAGRAILDDQYFVIVSSLKNRQEAIVRARHLEESGFDAEVINSVTGFYGVALGRYSFEDAKRARKAAIQNGFAGEDAYLMTGDRVTEYVYPE